MKPKIFFTNGLWVATCSVGINLFRGHGATPVQAYNKLQDRIFYYGIL